MSRFSDAIERARRQQRERHSAEVAAELRDRVRSAPAVHSLGEALSQDQLALIVEPKRATADRGVINPHLDVALVARECQAGGATALSIVTDTELSLGSLDDLRAARAACELPLLARDFIVHTNQVYELRAAGADAIFVPVTAFLGDEPEDEPERLEAIVAAGYELGMDVVLSVQDEDELECALDTDGDILNIDNRHEQGSIDVERTFELLSEVPVGTAVISESVASGDEVARLHRAGVDALLLDEGHAEGDLRTALAVYHDLTLHAGN